MFRFSLMMPILVLLGISNAAMSSEINSYLVVFEQSDAIMQNNPRGITAELVSQLNSKLNKLNITTGLRINPDRSDKLWISQSVRMDLSSDQVEQVKSNSAVINVVRDDEVRLELPLKGKRPIARAKYTYGLESLQVPEVWKKYKLRGEGITVGVIDTGWANHIDLRGKVLRSKDFISKFAENVPNDDQGHGTHCMGTIGGGNESGKSIGVAPAVKFVVAKIFDANGRATRSGILKAMQWMTDPDGDPNTDDFPRVVSNSWGKKYEGFSNETQYRRATKVWRDLNIAPVFAAGNSGPNKNTIASPGALESTLAIAALDKKDSIASFSSRGSVAWEDGRLLEKPDVSAPGVDVYSSHNKGGYVSWSGTSMACPHVAGVIALMLQANPELSVDQIFSILKQSAYELGDDGWDEAYGYGKISALRAVEIALNLSSLALNIDANSAPVRITDTESGQIYRFKANTTHTLYLKEGSYSLNLQSFGFVDQKLQVELSKGKTTKFSTKLEKAPTATWILKVISENNKPILANLEFVDVPIEKQNVSKEGIELELPQSTYKYILTAYGYRKITGRLKLDQNKRTLMKMKPLKDVLIINSTRDEVITRYITSSIPREYDYDYTNRYRSITLDELKEYKRVLWFTGDEKWRALPFVKREMLQYYFNDGGTVILTGQNTSDNLESSDFTEDLFGINVSRQKSAQKRLKGLGLGMRINEGSSAKNQDSPEEISVVSDDTEMLLTWMNNQGAMSERSSGRSRAYYLGFGLEGLATKDRNRITEIMFERSSDTLLNELQYAATERDPMLRKQIINFASTIRAKSKTKAIEAMSLLETLKLGKMQFFKELQSQINFQSLHGSK